MTQRICTDDCYKILLISNDNGNKGVDILLSEERIEKNYDINRVSTHLRLIKITIDNNITTVLLSCYAPHTGMAITLTDTNVYIMTHTKDSRMVARACKEDRDYLVKAVPECLKLRYF